MLQRLLEANRKLGPAATKAAQEQYLWAFPLLEGTLRPWVLLVESKKGIFYLPKFMRKFVALLLTTAVVSFAIPAHAQSHHTYSQPRSVTKIEKKQAKAQKKYAKQQKKAEKKMLKTERKNTHYPPQRF
jgi:cell envelope opacity-associated protein A